MSTLEVHSAGACAVGRNMFRLTGSPLLEQVLAIRSALGERTAAVAAAMSDRIPAGLARRIRLVLFDVDGVLTDGGLYIGRSEKGDAVELKRFDITDGLGVHMLVWSGLRVALVSGRESPATRLRAAELGIECYEDAGARKIPLVAKLVERHGVLGRGGVRGR